MGMVEPSAVQLLAPARPLCRLLHRGAVVLVRSETGTDFRDEQAVCLEDDELRHVHLHGSYVLGPDDEELPYEPEPWASRYRRMGGLR